MAAGLGAAAAVATLIERALLRPLPYADADRIVRIETVEPLRAARSDNAARDVFDYAAAATRVRDVVTYLVSDYNLTVDGRAVPVTLTFASADIWALAGIAPALGATFTADDDRPGGTIRKVVLSDGLWRRQFGADPGIIGQSIVLGTASYEVLGVMPRGFAFPERAEAWVPIEAWFSYLGTTRDTVIRGARSYGGAGRLLPAASMADAQAEADDIATGLAAEHPPTNQGVRFLITPFGERLAEASRPFLRLGGWAVALLLATSAAAVASMFSALRLVRRPTLELQLALGATRRRLLAEAAIGSLPLVLAASALALVVGTGLTHVVARLVPDPRPVWLEPGLSPVMILGVIAATALLALLGCAGGAIGVGRSRPFERSATTVTAATLRMRRVLIGVQVSLAVALTVGAFTIASNLARLMETNPGFDPGGVVGVYVSPPGDDFAASERGARYAEFYDRVLDDLQRIPGVRSAAGINVLPLRPRAGWQRNTITAFGQDPQQQERNPVVNVLRTSPAYFRTMGIPMLDGRDFDGRDTGDTARIAVISANLAQRLWPGTSPIGNRLKLGAPGSPSPWATVVGVTADVRSSLLDGAQTYTVYFSYRQVIAGELNFVVKSDRSAADTIAAVTDVIQRINSRAAVFRAQPLQQLVTDSIWQQRLWGTAIALFAACASIVGAVGLYALLTATAGMRRREFAIRVALGAAPADLLRIMLRDNGWIVGAGCVAGALAATVAFHAGFGAMTGISSAPPAAIAGAVSTAAILCATASVAPLRRVTRADPATTLRGE